jgi:hypothetical protein
MSRVAPLLFFAVLTAAPACAETPTEFMQRFAGKWVGTGQLLFGEGTEFACELSGAPSGEMTFGMTGRCWMGAVSAPVHASLRYNQETDRFYGEFMDGSGGSGLDIVGHRAGEGVSLQLTRGGTQGRLAAERTGGDDMKVTIYYRDMANDRELPVVAMGFVREEVVTGSVTGN